MEESELLKRAEDLCRRSGRTGKITSTAFLTPAERIQLEARLHPDYGIRMCFYGGYEDCERSIAVFLPEEDETEPETEPPEAVRALIRAVRFRAYYGEPGHRDYLGALVASGVARDRLGDILIAGEETTVFCLSGILSHLMTVDRIGRVSVKAEEIDLGDILIPKRERKEKSFTVMSMRLDAVAAGMFNLSRTACARQIAEGNLSLNFSVCMKTDAPVKEGDVISLRGHGKGVVSGLGGSSRKGRQFVEAEIYV